ncbi:hypothetical protein HD806DRAFT_523901 [Xylariaceae sp. AK1471]|nr:hypothetical protein HD806DRAFT_523901 [Xylariaceae sp. AK1471]
MFQIHECARESLDVVTLWLAENENALDEDVNNIDCLKRQSITRTMKRRLNSRTRGLLEISKDGRIDYLHRSVRDWAVENWSAIQSAAPNFDPYLALLRATTVESGDTHKLVNAHSMISGVFWAQVCNCFYHASRVHQTMSTASISYPLPGNVLALYRDITFREIERRDQVDLPHWATTQFTRTVNSRPITFLGLTAQFCLIPYVKYKVLEDDSRLKPDRNYLPILLCAILGFDHFARPDILDIASHPGDQTNFESRWELVSFLVDQGATKYLEARSSQSSVLRQDVYDQVQQKISSLEKSSNADPKELQY